MTKDMLLVAIRSGLLGARQFAGEPSLGRVYHPKICAKVQVGGGHEKPVDGRGAGRARSGKGTQLLHQVRPAVG
jgi:hypothetical protein